METSKVHRISLPMLLLWLFEGALVGFGAILPGVSGGTLCVAFGMYRPIIEIFSSPKKGIKNYGIMIAAFLIGAGLGFVGLSGLAAMLLEKNTTLVTCAFIGFILGTIPGLWKEAGEEGRKKSSYIAMIVSFAIMIAILAMFKTTLSLKISPGIPAYLLCGVLWGLSFIVPGLSSSSLLLFFGLYKPMLSGISSFNMAVLIPMAIGMGACVLLLSKAMGNAYKNHYSIVSHAVLGIVVATAVMIFPIGSLTSVQNIILDILFIFLGGVVSFLLTKLCDKLKENEKNKTE